MQIKKVIAALALTVGAVTGASATTAWSLYGAPASGHSANLFGNESGAFGFSLSGASLGQSLVVSGDNLVGVSLDGVSFTKGVVAGYEKWSLAASSLAAGAHSLLVTVGGNYTGSYTGSFFFNAGTLNTGSLVATPVPEPETLALMLAGLGALGISARRRRQA